MMHLVEAPQKTKRVLRAMKPVEEEVADQNCNNKREYDGRIPQHRVGRRERAVQHGRSQRMYMHCRQEELKSLVEESADDQVKEPEQHATYPRRDRTGIEWHHQFEEQAKVCSEQNALARAQDSMENLSQDFDRMHDVLPASSRPRC